MKTLKNILCLTGAFLAIAGISGCATHSEQSQSVKSFTKQSTDIEKIELTVANDGKSLVDQNGVEKIKASGDVRFGKDGEKMQGCMRCWNECIVYDSNGRCVKTIRTCQWDFDCK